MPRGDFTPAQVRKIREEIHKEVTHKLELMNAHLREMVSVLALRITQTTIITEVGFVVRNEMSLTEHARERIYGTLLLALDIIDPAFWDQFKKLSLRESYDRFLHWAETGELESSTVAADIERLFQAAKAEKMKGGRGRAKQPNRTA
jgi:hypothetical protein